MKVLILQNHGLAALGSTVEEAFDILIKAVEACKVQVRHTAVASCVVEGSDATVVCMTQHAVVELLPNDTNKNYMGTGRHFDNDAVAFLRDVYKQ